MSNDLIRSLNSKAEKNLLNHYVFSPDKIILLVPSSEVSLSWSKISAFFSRFSPLSKFPDRWDFDSDIGRASLFALDSKYDSSIDVASCLSGIACSAYLFNRINLSRNSVITPIFESCIHPFHLTGVDSDLVMRAIGSSLISNGIYTLDPPSFSDIELHRSLLFVAKSEIEVLIQSSLPEDLHPILESYLIDELSGIKSFVTSELTHNQLLLSR